MDLRGLRGFSGHASMGFFPRTKKCGARAYCDRNGWCEYGQRKSERDRIGQTKIRQHSHNVTTSYNFNMWGYETFDWQCGFELMIGKVRALHSQESKRTNPMKFVESVACPLLSGWPSRHRWGSKYATFGEPKDMCPKLIWALQL